MKVSKYWKLAKRGVAMVVAAAMLSGTLHTGVSLEVNATEAETVTPQQAVNLDAASLLFINRNITGNLTLATTGEKGSTISWKSSNVNVLTDQGVVTRPAVGESDANVTLEATITMDNFTKTRKFDFVVLAQTSLGEVNQFELDEVELLDTYYATAEEADIAFLKKFNNARILSRFRETAGLSTKGAKPYRGWEDSLLGGHCVGHYLTAAAQGVRASGDVELKEKLETIIDGLAECQDNLGTGFIFGARIDDNTNVEKQFDIVEEKGWDSAIWVPWYNMHKLVQGLVDVYKYTGNEKALEIASKLGDWIYNRTSKWSSTVRNRVLGVEYGGMNDCLYELYSFTKSEKHLTAAHKFDEDNLFKTVSKGGKNCLSGKHANTIIPKFLGGLKRYVILKELGELKDSDKNYLSYAEKFFDIVVSRHTYITGGVSVMEHFRDDNKQDATRTQTNCESCCAHNMLKMAKELFKATGEKKYADYYETTLRNAIMGAVKEKTAQAAYFIPMATGFYKTFGDADPSKNMFWCCTGSGMENFTKLQDSIYFHTEDKLIVNQYVSSKVTWAEKNMVVVQESDVEKSDIAKFTIDVIDGNAVGKADLVLRVPDWMHGKATIKVNGTVAKDAVSTAGYITVKKDWVKGDEVTIKYPMQVDAFGLPDNNEVYAFRYGPTVLAAKLGKRKMSDDPANTYNTWAGANLTAPRYRVVGIEEQVAKIEYGESKAPVPLKTEYITIEEDKPVFEYLDQINNYFVKDPNSETLSFRLKGTNDTNNFVGGLEFVPFNTLNDERYGIYWHYQSEYTQTDDSLILEGKAGARDANNFLDSTQPGYGQYEQDAIHQLTEKDSLAGTIAGGGSTRCAKAGGYFSYNFIVDETKDIFISTQFAKEDNGKTLKVSVGTTEVANLTLDYTGNDNFYQQKIDIPASVLKENIKTITGEDGKKYTVVPVRFESASKSADSARLVGNISVMIAYSKNATLTAIGASTGTVQNENDTYTVILPQGTTEVGLTFKIADQFGLLYVNDKLVDDTTEQKFAVGTEVQTLKVKVFAEDHITAKEYNVILAPTLPTIPTQPSPTNKRPGSTSKKKASISISGKKTVKKGKSITLTVKKKNTKKKARWSVNKKKLAKLKKKSANKVVLKALKKGKVKVTVKVGSLKKSITIKIK